ncbi:sensor histidine kinase [Undibacterium flavidum]|uniref:histidine kinase n=1 Tax=Undibacterium flavidum TaxID=2762297 RepID=A0ABR6Y7Y9_9BURK|nr:response regulator [Undibacterium flavidum]MBC3872700.1 response regulator [Undibacterium flavidum]
MSEKFLILTVDDNPNNLFVLNALLSGLPNVELVEAASGEAALSICVTRDVHLILLDVQMPVMDGYETAQHLQMIEKTRNIPIVFITAVFKNEAFIQRGYAVGAVDYLTKPIDDCMLLNRVRHYQHLRKRELELKEKTISLEKTTKLLEQAQSLLVGKVRKSTADLQTLLDAALEFTIVSTDTAGNITTFNHGAELMLGYKANEVLGKSPTIWHLEEEVAAHAIDLSEFLCRPIEGFETFVAVARLNGSSVSNWTFVRKDGTRFLVSLVVSLVLDENGEHVGFLGIARDISAQVEAESNLLKLNQQLDQRVKERTEQLQNALDHLQQTQNKLVESEKLAALGVIVAAVAHELNTPIGNCITAVSTQADLSLAFEEKLDSKAPLRRSELSGFVTSTRLAIEIIERGLRRASELVNGFKQIAALHSGLEKHQFNLSNTLHHILADIKAHVESNGYQIELDVPASIHMHSYPDALGQIIRILISNSTVHGYEGKAQGLIQIKAEIKNEQVELVYRDFGKGLSEEVRKHIFDPFFTTRLGQGTNGLGMTTCYNLVTGPLQGIIDLDSSEGKGVCFTLLLPVDAHCESGSGVTS